MVKAKSNINAQTPSTIHPRQRLVSVIILFVAGVLLFSAQSAYWVNHTVFNKTTFTHIISSSLMASSSRDAIASTVVDEALKERPLIREAIGDRAASFIAGLLGSDIGERVITSVSEKAYQYATSPNREDIAVRLTAIKQPIAAIVAVAESTGRDVAIDPSKIPDQITLVKEETVPDLSGVLVGMIWLEPLLWLATIGLFGGYIYRGRRSYARAVYHVIAVIAVVGLIGLVATPLLPPQVAAVVPEVDLRVLAETLTANFLAPFRSQMIGMLVVVAVIAVAFNQRFTAARLATTVKEKAVGAKGRVK